ncbi:RPL14A, partial [Rozella allomycis CSF55]
AIVDGPTTGVARQQLSFRRLAVTPFKVSVPRGSRSKTIKKVFEAEKIAEKWETTSWAKKLAVREKRAAMSDFDRFKAMLLKKQRRAVVGKEYGKLKKAAKL